MRSPWSRILQTDAPAAVALVRLSVGWVFLTEGIQKFLFPEALAAGRFAKIGIPFPEVTGPFVATVEVVAGALIVLGLLTRPAALALAIEMIVALASTKVPMLVGHGFWGFAAPAPDKTGLWAMAHEARTDVAMLLTCLSLLWMGAGPLSADAIVTQER